MSEHIRKYQVFISSTFEDLKEERALVLSMLWKNNYLPAAMEYFPASGTSQLEYIDTILDNTDAYVLILAGKYGSLTDTGFSYTEEEFNLALKKHIQVFPFVYSDISLLPGNKLETDAKKKTKLEVFRRRLLSGNLVSKWGNASELALNVLTSLSMASLKGGWTRGEEAVFNTKYPKVLEENSKLTQQLETARQQISSLESRLQSCRSSNSDTNSVPDDDSILLTIEPHFKNMSGWGQSQIESMPEWELPQRQSQRMTIDEIMLYWGSELSTYCDEEDAFSDLASVVAEQTNTANQTAQYKLSLRSRNELKANLSARGLIELHSDYDNFSQETTRGINLTETGKEYIRLLVAPNSNPNTDSDNDNRAQNEKDPWSTPEF
jgi:cell division septum initiation protein DivIVA